MHTPFSRGKIMQLRTWLLSAIIIYLSFTYSWAEEADTETYDTLSEVVDAPAPIEDDGSDVIALPAENQEAVAAPETSFVPDQSSPESKVDKVVVIPVEGTVNSAMAAFISRVIRDEPQRDKTVFILEMDTFGGRVDAALDIVDTISNIPEGRTVAYVEKRAISAGASPRSRPGPQSRP